MKTAVVTGGADGIGRATSKLFARKGFRVVVADIDEPGAERVADEIKKSGGSAIPFVLDVRDEHQWAHFAEWVEIQFGHADVLINNAGVMDLGGFVDTDVEAWQRMIDINLMSVVYGSKIFAQQMLDQEVHGHIANVSSAASFIPSGIDAAYGAAKAAVLMATQSLRTELARDGIGVSAICPGAVRTNLVRHGTRNGLGSSELERWQDDAGAAQHSLSICGPEKVAAAIYAAVDRNRAVVPVSPEAWLAYGAFRASPALVRRLASFVDFTTAEALMGRVESVTRRFASGRQAT